MLLSGENKDYSTWIYDYKIDKEDAEKLLLILKEYLSKSKVIANYFDNDALDISSGELIQGNHNYVIDITKSNELSKKIKKLIMKKLKKENKKISINTKIYNYAESYYFIGKIIDLLKEYCSEEELIKLCEADKIASKFIKQNSKSYQFTFNDYFKKFPNINLEKFIKICESLNHDPELLDAFLDNYPDIKLLKQIAPYLNLIPQYSLGSGLIAKDSINIAKSFYSDYEPSSKKKFYIDNYEEAILTKKLLDTLDIEFKSIGLKKHKPDLTIEQKEEAFNNFNKLEYECGDYLFSIRLLININREQELGPAFFAELEKSLSIPNNIKVQIFKALTDEKAYLSYNAAFEYPDYCEHYEWYQKQLSVYWKELYPILLNLDKRAKSKTDDEIYEDEKKYYEILDQNSKLRYDEKINKYKTLIEGINTSKENIFYVDEEKVISNEKINIKKHNDKK